jgi:hypothetical protein
MPPLDKTTLILQTRKELIETGTTSGQWDDVEIAEFLQEANERLTDIAELEELPASAVTAAGVEYASYPATIGKIRAVWCRAQNSTSGWTRLKKAQLEDRVPDTGSSANRGAPVAYYIYARKIFLAPIPDVVYDLSVLGYKFASDLVGGAGSVVPLFDMKFHPLTKIYAVARCKQKVDDPGYANYDAQYSAGETALQMWVDAEKHQEGPRMPKIVSGMWD